MVRRILSLFLVLTLLINVPHSSELTFGMDGPPHSVETIPQTPREKSSGTGIKLSLVLLGSAISLMFTALAGFFGYRFGRAKTIDDEKELTLVGSIEPTPGLLPSSGRYYPDKMLNLFIDKLFLEDIPKYLSQDEFPASHLAAIETHLKVLSNRYSSKDLPYEYRKMSEDLIAMSQFIGSYVDVRGKKIQAGYLKKLLKDAQKLVQEATATTEKMEREKEQNEREL